VDDHVDIVSAHIVTGANIFQDVFASFRDIFGGQARSYQEKLAEIDEGVVEILKDKAHEQGAQGITGLRIDHDSVSGKGKSMFMVTASGTAVTLTPASDHAKRVAGERSADGSSPQKEDVWLCRCGTYNNQEAETCSSCQRSPDAII